MTEISSEEFLQRFFSPPNVVWPGMAPGVSVAATILPFLAALSTPGECPVILPCRRPDQGEPTAVYVVCWNTAHAGRVRALLESAVAHHWCAFDGRVARLDSADPVDASVLDLVGPGTTFVLRPTAQTATATFTALNRLVSTIGGAPLRVPRAPRPLGRMLREFDVALASGAVESSASLLREIEAYGGVSHENIAFLQIRRLAQLGKDHELLSHGSLPTLIYVEPPRLVREGVLSAWARVNLARPIPSEEVDVAVATIENAEPDVAMLVDEDFARRSSDPDASTVCALVAIARHDTRLATTVAANSAVDGGVRQRLDFGPEASAVDLTHVPATPTPELAVDADTPTAPKTPVDSWLSWVGRLGSEEAVVLEAGQALDWPAAWRVDAELARAIDALPEVATDDLLSGVTALLEADDPDRPAAFTAAALVRRYLVAERFKPFDLGAICALIGIFLRSGPSSDAYREVLGDVRGFAPQWVSVGTATRAIDLADVVALGPSVDSAARIGLVTTLLSPLHEQRHRLTETDRLLAELVASDVGLRLEWTSPGTDEARQVVGRLVDPAILLYSLDPGSLQRAKTAIGVRWPSARVSLSSAKVGDQSLRQHCRNADIIVLATRRAAHAATNFIAANKSERAQIAYPDGSGSASMMRAVETAVGDWSS